MGFQLLLTTKCILLAHTCIGRKQYNNVYMYSSNIYSRFLVSWASSIEFICWKLYILWAPVDWKEPAWGHDKGINYINNDSWYIQYRTRMQSMIIHLLLTGLGKREKLYFKAWLSAWLRCEQLVMTKQKNYIISTLLDCMGFLVEDPAMVLIWVARRFIGSCDGVDVSRQVDVEVLHRDHPLWW